MVPLHVAAEAGRYKIVGLLYGDGVDINMKDDNGVSIQDYKVGDPSSQGKILTCSCLSQRRHAQLYELFDY